MSCPRRSRFLAICLVVAWSRETIVQYRVEVHGFTACAELILRRDTKLRLPAVPSAQLVLMLVV